MNSSELKELALHSKTLKVLYIEDSQESREQTLKLLENFFSNIIVAVNGQDGLDKFLNNGFDLVITDLYMPVMNGMDMIKNIRLKDKKTPIIITTAHNETSFKTEASKYDIMQYFIKPIDFNMIIDVLVKLKKV